MTLWRRILWRVLALYERPEGWYIALDRWRPFRGRLRYGNGAYTEPGKGTAVWMVWKR